MSQQREGYEGDERDAQVQCRREERMWEAVGRYISAVTMQSTLYTHRYSLRLPTKAERTLAEDATTR